MFRTKKKRPILEQIPAIIIHSPPDENNFRETIFNEKNATSTPLFNENKDAGCNFTPKKDVEEVSSTSLSPETRMKRRNSISLPNLDDLNAIKEQVQLNQNNNNCSEASNSEYDITETEFRVPLRSIRRKSVIYPRMLRNNAEDESPANSITSVNSLASLLREKMQMLPQTFKKRKSPDYKIKIFVIFLFFLIVFLVSFAYVLYEQKVLQKAYFEKIKLNNVQRIMKIFNDDGKEAFTAKLGTTLNYDTVNPCLPEDQLKDGSICMEWMHRARLYINLNVINEDIKCYNLRWIALSNIEPTDCIDFSSSHWYGGGQNAQSEWHLEKAAHPFTPFITGVIDKFQWGNVLKRYFISSKGVAIIIDDKTPLYTSVSKKHPKQFCLKAKYDSFAYVNKLDESLGLNYSVCVSSNTTILHSNLIENTLWDGLKQEDLVVMNSLLTEPIWEINMSPLELTEETLRNYTEDVIGLGFLKQGHVLINEFWQKNVGDFKLDAERFPTLELSIDMMHRRGFRVVFSIQPFISTESFNFAEAVKKQLLIFQRYSNDRIPALTKYKTVNSAGMIDPTNNETIPWLLEKLKETAGKYKVDSFYLDVGIAYDMPQYYQSEQELLNPDEYKTVLVGNLQKSVSLLGVNSAVVRPKAPIFVSLPPFESSWDGLRQVIPTILSFGTLGYPFIIPGAVGGDYIGPGSNISVNGSELLPDRELYLRWLQLSSFLPVIRFRHLPSTYGDSSVLEMVKISTSLRHNKVTPLLKKYARIALDTGFPIIRPLWMMDSDDPSCHAVADEFSIGDDLIVAPVLYSGARHREVYLPAGVWKDGIDGSYRKGNRWIHNYKVEENEVAYFEKMPDNTRL